MSDVVNAFLLVYAGLFPIVNPIGGAPIFLGLTRQCSDEERSVIARRVAINGFLLLLGSMIIGSLEFFGITLPVVRIAGGGYFLRLSLPERYAATVKEGSTVKVAQRALSSGDEDVAPTLAAGKLVKVYPEITDGRVTADVDVDGLGDYFVGERTLVWVSAGARRVFVVPAGFVFRRAGVNYVKTVDGAEIVVQPGERRDNGIEILAGLADDDTLVAP